jgi:hypothetical protein
MNEPSNGTNAIESAYPTQRFYQRIARVSIGLIAAITLVTFLCGFVLARLLSRSSSDPLSSLSTMVAGSTNTSVSITDFGGCQFLVFQRPFFVLHWPQCKGPHTVVPVEKPLPPRPPNMP